MFAPFTAKNDMKKIKKTIAIAWSLIASMSASTALAQVATYAEGAAKTFDMSAYIAPSISLISPDKDFGTDRRITGGGLRFGRHVSQSWDMQLGLNLARANDGANRYEQTALGLDALYMFSRSRFRPMLLVGVGIQQDKFTGSTGQKTSTSPYIVAGGGFQFSFNEQWGMQADIRRNRAYLRGNDFSFNRANTDIASVALTYAFEKVTAPAARVAPAPAYSAPSPVAQSSVPVLALSTESTVLTAQLPVAARIERTTIAAKKLFAPNSALLQTPILVLDDVADALVKNIDVSNIVISGHTDRLGSDVNNLNLSQKRADAVKNYLASRGVAAMRMTATGKGASSPLVFCTDKKMTDLIRCLGPNRRVEVEEITIERRVQ